MEVLAGLLTVLEKENAKVLLFSCSTTLLDILEAYISSKGYTHCRLDGSTRTDLRQQMMKEFNSNQSIFIFLLSTKAGGLGLNITGANTVIIFDPNWLYRGDHLPEAALQAAAGCGQCGRLHRQEVLQGRAGGHQEEGGALWDQELAKGDCTRSQGLLD